MTAEFTVAEAAGITGYTKGRLYQMIKKQQIAFRRVKVRADVRIPQATVEELRAKKAGGNDRENQHAVPAAEAGEP
jgi:excisionase family DNA binding protein